VSVPAAAQPCRIKDFIPEIGALTGGELTRDRFILRSLALMRDMGFARSRYYDVAEDVVRDQRVWVLTHESPDSDPVSRLGLLIDYPAASFSHRETGLFPAVESSVGDGAVAEAFVCDLGLEGRSWVDIPVTVGDNIVGVVACDWVGSAAALAADDVDALRIVGSLIGGQLALNPTKAVNDYRALRLQWIAKPPEKDVKRPGPPMPAGKLIPPEELLRQAAEHIASAVDAATLAVFTFSWQDQRLTKLGEEWVADEFRTRASMLEPVPESYAVGETLTGKAWLPDGFRHIVDFRSVDADSSEWFKPEPRGWYERLLGDVHTVLFASVGALDRRYLIRMTNRARRPELPFLSEAALFDALVSELRSDIDASVASERRNSLQEIARLAAGPGGPEEIADSIERALQTERVDHFGVLCHQDESSQFGFETFHGPRLKTFEFDLAHEWRSDDLYVATATGDDGVYRLGERRERSALATGLEKLGYKAILSYAIHTGQTRGVFFVPLGSVEGKRGDEPADCGFGTASLLHAYSRLIGNAVETQNARARVDGARRALGLIGHELRGPLAAANSEAELAVNAARRVLRDHFGSDFQGQDAYKELQQHTERMWDRQRQVSNALELAPLVAQESQGQLQLHFGTHRLYELVRGAVGDVEDELRLNRTMKRYEFAFAPSSRKLGPVVCDGDYIRHVFKNVLRNAVKYSLPRQPGEPMLIELIGEPQSHHVGVKIRNWGFGIPDERRDLIFEPWVRGEIVDDVKAIGGMGLGLFLARRILAAHSGAILFTSRPTLNDPDRLAKLEGYETVFEIRLPLTLVQGTHTHEWGPVIASKIEHRP
jgi:signal transduction histidine kinase